MGKNIVKKMICMVLALSLVLGTGAMAFAATGSQEPTPTPAPTKHNDYKASERGKAVKKAKNQKVVVIEKDTTKICSKAFSKCKKVRVIKIKTTKRFYVHKNAFKGLKKSQKKKIKVYVNKKMSKKNFKYLKKKLKKAGIKSKNIKRNLKVK